jgi:hypothetical protein
MITEYSGLHTFGRINLGIPMEGTILIGFRVTHLARIINIAYGTLYSPQYYDAELMQWQVPDERYIPQRGKEDAV